VAALSTPKRSESCQAATHAPGSIYAISRQTEIAGKTVSQARAIDHVAMDHDDSGPTALGGI
jgi:hypothetical protein